VEGTILYLIRTNIVQGISIRQFTAEGFIQDQEFQFTCLIFHSAVSFLGYIKSTGPLHCFETSQY